MGQLTAIALTLRQQMAMRLVRAGKSHAEIAEVLDLKHRESASQLIGRAKKAEKAFRSAAVQYLEIE